MCYCSREGERKDWKQHKTVCKAAAASPDDRAASNFSQTGPGPAQPTNDQVSNNNGAQEDERLMMETYQEFDSVIAGILADTEKVRTASARGKLREDDSLMFGARLRVVDVKMEKLGEKTKRILDGIEERKKGSETVAEGNAEVQKDLVKTERDLEPVVSTGGNSGDHTPVADPYGIDFKAIVDALQPDASDPVVDNS